MNIRTRKNKKKTEHRGGERSGGYMGRGLCYGKKKGCGDSWKWNARGEGK